MKERQRQSKERAKPERNVGPDQSPSTSDLEATGSDGANLLAAANQAIDRFLSGNSETFNTQARQSGGQ